MKPEVVKTAVPSDGQKKGSRARQTIATMIISLGMAMFGFVNGWSSPTIPLFLSPESPVALTETEVSWVMGAAHMGAVLGTVPSALFLNHLGRRGTLMMFNVMSVISWILMYYATSFRLILTARFLSGIWIGCCFTIIPSYTSEMVDPAYRSSLHTLCCFIQRLGTLAVFTIGTYSSYWVLSIVGLGLGLVYGFALLLVPESPYYYIMVHKEEKAFKSLAWLQNSNNIEEQFNKLRQFIHIDTENKGSIFDLLRDPIHMKNVIKITLANVFSVTSGGVLIVILPIVIPERSITYLNNKECSIVGAFVCLMFSFRPGCLSLASNKLSLIISGTVCGICMAAMAMWYYFENKYEVVKLDLCWVPFASYLIHIVFYSLYMYPTVLGLRGEMFPTKFKTSLGALVATSSTASISFVLQAYLPIKTHFGSHVNFIIGCVSCFSLVVLTYFFLIETEGKSLQDIQNDLNSVSVCSKKKVVRCKSIEI